MRTRAHQGAINRVSMTTGRPISPEILVRPWCDADSHGLIELIGTIWRSYPGIVFDVEAELPELKAPATAFAEAGGRGWIAERGGRILASIGTAPTASHGLWELLKLYVDGESAARASPAAFWRWRRNGPGNAAPRQSSYGRIRGLPRRTPSMRGMVTGRKACAGCRTSAGPWNIGSTRDCSASPQWARRRDGE